MRQITDIYIFFVAFSRGKIYESKEEDLSTNQRIKNMTSFSKTQTTTNISFKYPRFVFPEALWRCDESSESPESEGVVCLFVCVCKAFVSLKNTGSPGQAISISRSIPTYFRASAWLYLRNRKQTFEMFSDANKTQKLKNWPFLK